MGNISTMIKASGQSLTSVTGSRVCGVGVGRPAIDVGLSDEKPDEKNGEERENAHLRDR